MLDPFLVRLIIAIGVWVFFYEILVKNIVKDPKAKEAFMWIILGVDILFLVFGAFLPIRIG